MSLLRALTYFQFPLTSHYRLDNVPADSKFVRAFTCNLRKNQFGFLFNWNSKSKMESSKYIQELKFAANKTGVAFGVANLTFSIEDFKSLVVSAKHVGYLYIMDSLIPLDCEFDFGEQLNFSNIGVFDVGN